MRKYFAKLLALLLCISVLGSGTSVSASGQMPASPKATTEEPAEPDVPTEPVTPEEPIAPVLRGKLSAAKTITLSWTVDDANATYTLSRSTSESGTYREIFQESASSGTRSYRDQNLKLGTTYYYKLTKTTADSITCESSVKAVKVQLFAPANVKTSVDSSNDVTISWKKVSDASGYTVYRSTSKSGSYKKLSSTTKLSYTDKTPYSGKAYYYKVYAYRSNNSAAQSPASSVAAAYTKPGKTTISSAKYSSNQVKLSWKKVTRATSYYIYRMNSKGEYKQIGTSKSCSYKDTTAKKNVRYKYKVKAAYSADKKVIKGKFSSFISIYTAKIDPKKKMVALTFDDGPGPYTQEIVNCLKKNDARATFFVIGNRVNSYKSTLTSAYDNGNLIANHTYSHPTLISLNTSSVKSQISKTDSAVKKLTGEVPSLMRAPGGATNSRVRNAIDKPFIYWSIDTLDWKHRNKQKTIDTVMRNVKDGDIILMHDIHKPSKEAALELIPKLKKAGYQLVTVEELAEYQGYTMKDHTTYYSFR